MNHERTPGSSHWGHVAPSCGLWGCILRFRVLTVERKSFPKVGRELSGTAGFRVVSALSFVLRLRRRNPFRALIRPFRGPAFILHVEVYSIEVGANLNQTGGPPSGGVVFELLLVMPTPAGELLVRHEQNGTLAHRSPVAGGLF